MWDKLTVTSVEMMLLHCQ